MPFYPRGYSSNLGCHSRSRNLARAPHFNNISSSNGSNGSRAANTPHAHTQSQSSKGEGEKKKQKKGGTAPPVRAECSSAFFEITEDCAMLGCRGAKRS